MPENTQFEIRPAEKWLLTLLMSKYNLCHLQKTVCFGLVFQGRLPHEFHSRRNISWILTWSSSTGMCLLCGRCQIGLSPSLGVVHWSEFFYLKTISCERLISYDVWPSLDIARASISLPCLQPFLISLSYLETASRAGREWSLPVCSMQSWAFEHSINLH